MPRDRVLINADYDVVLFHALKVYYFRVTDSDSTTSEIPPEIKRALTTMLDIVDRTFTLKTSVLHDRLQWPLFLAGIETDDNRIRHLILGSITSRRAREALERTIEHQLCSGKRLAMSVIKALLCESDLDSTYPQALDESYILDGFNEQAF